MNVYIRVDASFEIGTGHVMRCLTLAELLKEHGAAQITFICRKHEGNLCDYIKGKGFPVIVLPRKEAHHFRGHVLHANWLKVSQKVDAAETISFIKDKCVDLLVIDHYAIDIEWEKELIPYVERIMVIDDLADRKHKCHYLLDQNFYENMDTRYKTLVPDNCEKFLGPEFAILRKEFLDRKGCLRNRDGQIRRILIFFGGIDPSNETLKAIYAIKALSRKDIMVDVVVGSNNENKEHLKTICNKSKNITFHLQVNNMAELMNQADLCIGAGGTTTWERCVMGLPTILISIAKNQELIASTLSKHKIICYLGPKEQVTEKCITSTLQSLLDNPQQLKLMERLSKDLLKIEKDKLHSLIHAICERK
ncbi:UDP-2,4-diacetamido-2,4,6-trideoxy-beta-L-altropyranose hydrolase [Fredinandcohnia onubensis]|uniref:UDP-2,4-diacetamido-2,4, 6-trideoxy-beta-L-altropyranose hydrolase n=1 Tax=Fredinandcohnia onubensis TaxID=1571209 RepID=UPI000C0BE33C|nr:UDP-2,4-diacetamido-2,4,6-trideoxy-beta-L-altropyranose hydrolase [Fredinandcohnia onubensis]